MLRIEGLIRILRGKMVVGLCWFEWVIRIDRARGGLRAVRAQSEGLKGSSEMSRVKVGV